MKYGWAKQAAAVAPSAQATLEHWVGINSGSKHAAGLDGLLDALRLGFAELEADLQIIPCLGKPFTVKEVLGLTLPRKVYIFGWYT